MVEWWRSRAGDPARELPGWAVPFLSSPSVWASDFGPICYWPRGHARSTSCRRAAPPTSSARQRGGVCALPLRRGRRPSPVSRLHGCTGAVRHAPNPLCATGSSLVGLYQSIFREFRIIAKRDKLIYNCFWAKTDLQLRMRIYRGTSNNSPELPTGW